MAGFFQPSTEWKRTWNSQKVQAVAIFVAEPFHGSKRRRTDCRKMQRIPCGKRRLSIVKVDNVAAISLCDMFQANGSIHFRGQQIGEWRCCGWIKE